MILREAKPPRRPRGRWAYYVGALFFGAGLGALFFFESLLAGTGLALCGGWLYVYAREQR